MQGVAVAIPVRVIKKPPVIYDRYLCVGCIIQKTRMGKRGIRIGTCDNCRSRHVILRHTESS